MGRNFRVQFLERVCSADPSASIRLSTETGRLFLEEQLKHKGDLDVSKLGKYSLRYSLPMRNRAEIWKLLLKISAPWPEARQVVMANRKKEAARVWTTVRKMLTLHYERQLPQTPNARLIAMLVLFSSTDATIFDLQTTYFHIVEHKSLLLISQKISIIVKQSDLGHSNWEDIYWLTSQFHERLALDTAILTNLIEETMIALKQLTERLQSNYNPSDCQKKVESYQDCQIGSSNFIQSNSKEEDAQIFTCFDQITHRHIELWFRSAGSCWLSDEPLFMLWDKICAHEAVISLLKNTLFQLFGTIASVSTEMYKKIDPDDLITRTLSMSMQLQVVKMSTDDVISKSMLPSDIPISLTY
jgi:hypothetical protein